MTLNKVTLTLIAQPQQNVAALRQVNDTAHFRVRVISGTNLLRIIFEKPRKNAVSRFFSERRLVPDMTLTLKKTTLTLKMGGSIHLPQRGHILLRLCYQGQGHLIQGHIRNYPIGNGYTYMGLNISLSCLFQYSENQNSINYTKLIPSDVFNCLET